MRFNFLKKSTICLYTYEEKEMVSMQDILGCVSFFALNRTLQELNRAWDNCDKYDNNLDNCWYT